jgi:hypothetical protein
MQYTIKPLQWVLTHGIHDFFSIEWESRTIIGKYLIIAKNGYYMCGKKRFGRSVNNRFRSIEGCKKFCQSEYERELANVLEEVK